MGIEPEQFDFSAQHNFVEQVLLRVDAGLHGHQIAAQVFVPFDLERDACFRPAPNRDRTQGAKAYAIDFV